MLVRLRGSQALQIGRRRTREVIVGEYRSGAHHHAILHRDAVAYIDESIQLDSVADLHPVSHIGLFPDNTLFAYACWMTYMDVVPNRSAGADLDIRFNNSRWVDMRSHERGASTLVPNLERSVTSEP